MDNSKVALFVSQNSGKFAPAQLQDVKTKLEALSDDKFTLVSSIEFKDPTTLLILSILVGALGVDRFMLKEVGMGVLKLLTGGCCGILWIIDIFLIQNKTREYNYRKFSEMHSAM